MNLIPDIQTFSLFIASAITSLFAFGGIEEVPATPLPSPTSLNSVTKSGEYNYAGKSINYTLYFPKNGGEITGSIDGSCSGPITGTYDGKDGGDITGTLNATCFFAFIEKSFQIDYSGKLYLEEGRADLDWEGEVPLTENKGNFTLNFDSDN